MILMGIDVGTSSVKVLLVEKDGTVAGRASRDYPLETPRPGWAEQDADRWVDSAFEAIREVLKTSGTDAADIAGISFSGQMHGLVPLDEDGRVIRKSILWCDQRTQPQCDEIEELAGGRDALLSMTNNVMLSGYTGGKLLWLREEEPDNFARMRIFQCPKDYLRYRLTDELCMDVSEASGTGLFDTKNRRWSYELIDKIGLSHNLFPRTVESTEPAGTVSEKAAILTGLKAGTPCFAGGGDAVVQSFGSGLIHEGVVGTVIGTAGNVYMGFDGYRVNPGGKLQAFCGVTPGSYMSFGATQTAGGALRWFRDELCRDAIMLAEMENRNSFDLMGEMAMASEPGARGIVFTPYLSGERCPYPDPHARGVIYGLSLKTKQEDIVRAVMEGIVFSLRQIVEIYRSFTDVKMAVASGGGAASDLFLKMQADIFDMPVRTLSAASEGGAYGAALIAGIGLGWYKDAEEAISVLKTESETLPDADAKVKLEKSYSIYARLYPALKDTYAFGDE